MDRADPRPETITLILVGRTGAGKSQFCRYIATTEGYGNLSPSTKFRADDCIDSVTDRMESDVATVNCLSGEGTVRIFDTRGLSDTAGRDQAIISETVKAIREVDNCSAIVIVLDSSNMRLDAATAEMLEYFRDIFGPSVIDNIVFAFTRCNKEQVAKFRGEPAKYAQAWSHAVCKLWGVASRDIPSFYLNTHKSDPCIPHSDVHEQELDKFFITCMWNRTISLSHAVEVDTRETAAEAAVAAAEEKAAADRASAEVANKQVELLKQSGEDARRAHNEMVQMMKGQIEALGRRRGRRGWCTIM